MLLSRASSSQAEVGGLPPPPGISVDLSRPDTNIYKYNVACVVLCYIVVGSIVLARIYTKVFINRKVVLEDYICILAWLLAIPQCAIALACDQYRGGSHQWDVPMNYVISFLRLQYFSQLVYYGAAFFTKTAILCLVARIFNPHRRAVFFTRVIIVLMALYYAPAFFIKVFRCSPIHKVWDSMAPGNCIASEPTIFAADTATSLVSDFAILILPMPLVWQLKTSLKRKLRIMIVFAGGTLACAANVARTIENYSLNGQDATYSIEIMMLLAITEVNVGLICSCLPILPAFYQHFFGPTHESSSSLSSYHRLKALKTSANGTRRTNLTHNEEAQIETTTQKELSAVSHVAGGLSISIEGGPDAAEENGGSWNGGGILKTMGVEQTGVAVPERATLPRAQ